MIMIKGCATPKGTEAFAKRFSDAFQNHFFRSVDSLFLSSIGLGTYLGEMDDETDQVSREAAVLCLKSGVNVIDSAINYRAQRSERVIGRALGDLIRLGTVKREEIFVSTKGGFIPFDREFPKDVKAYLKRVYLEPGILTAGDIVQNCHAMSPRYLENQLNQSLKNLNLDAVDLYYLHNPEIQLEALSESEFYERLRQAFEFLEAQVNKGKVRMYGTATWNGFRLPRGQKGYLSLSKILEAAKQVGGAEHHFKAIQLPFNLAMPEAFAFDNQIWASNEPVSVCEFAKRSGLMVFTSGSLLQGRLTHSMPDSVKALFQGLSHDAACALQFTRSAPGVTSALCGMKQAQHIKENLTLMNVPPLSDEAFGRFFQKNEG